MKKTPPMTKFDRGDVVVTEMLFTDGSSTKKRPALVISGKEYNSKRDEIVLLVITSNISRVLVGDTKIKEWAKAGLLYSSVVTGIFFTLKKALIQKKLGKLQPDDFQEVEDSLRRAIRL